MTPVQSDSPSVLHVNDCAFTAERLLVEAHRRGLPWHFLPVAATGRTWVGPRAKAEKAVRGAAWLARLAGGAARHDLLHVHSGSVYRHSRLVPRRFVLHLHGTDIRTLQYDPAWRRTIHDAVTSARAVFFSTPDLAEHTLPLRPDATYLPVPIDVGRLPRWQPADGTPRVLFASRWDPSKGIDAQLSTAEALVRGLAGRAEVVGLDWGEAASRAAAAGVRLLPRTDHEGYLRTLAGAHVVVGQSAGILAASELEALGVGAPLVLPVDLPLYEGLTPPVAGGAVDEAVDAVRTLLAAAPDETAAEVRRAWVAEHHGVEQAVDTVLSVYRRVVS
ncbi:MAG TPA: hypothetical protein VF314_04185 [Actinomycetes bacterium]